MHYVCMCAYRGISREDQIVELARSMASQLPGLYDIEAVSMLYPTGTYVCVYVCVHAMYVCELNYSTHSVRRLPRVHEHRARAGGAEIQQTLTCKHILHIHTYIQWWLIAIHIHM